MSWLGVEGHDAIIERFRRCVQRGRLASTFLMVGPAGIGKRTVALRLAQALLCQTCADEQLDACGQCPSCRLVQADNHPDLVVLGLPEGKSFIPLELLIGSQDHRMREGLCHRIALKPAAGSRKIAILDDVDYLNQEGANCLLKTLEEPPPRALLFLIGTSQQRQLPTIRSRAQVVRFRPLDADVVARLLVDKMGVDEQPASDLAQASGGSLTAAMELADPQWSAGRGELLMSLCQPNWDPLAMVQRAAEMVDEVGQEPNLRRARLRQMTDAVAELFRQLMRQLSGCPADGDQRLTQAVAAAVSWWPAGGVSAADAAARCLEARAQIDANANQATLLACWIDDLAHIVRGRPMHSPSP